MNPPADLARARRRKGQSRSTAVTVGVAAAGGIGSLLVTAGLALAHADTVAATAPASTGAVSNDPSAARQPQQPPPGGQVAPAGGGEPHAHSAGS